MKKQIQIPLTTLKFFRYEKDDLVFYEFDATQCQPPEPMVNTIHGLKMLKSEKDRLVGIFFHEPMPLYDKIGDAFMHKAVELENGDFKITFKKA